MTSANASLKHYSTHFSLANKLLLLLVLLTIGSIDAWAQQFKVSLSEGGDIDDDITTFYKNGNYVYTANIEYGKMQMAFIANLKKVKYGISITQYDEKLKELKKISIDNNEKDLGPFLPKVHYSKNGIIVVYFRFTSDDKIRMYAAKVDLNDLKVIKTSLILEYDQKNVGAFGLAEAYYENECHIAVSPDEKKIFLAHTSPKLIVTSVVDTDLTPVQKTEFTNVNLRNLMVTDSHVDNNGNKVVLYRYNNPALKSLYERGIFFQPANTKGIFAAINFADKKLPANLVLKQSADGKKIYLGGQYYIQEYDYGIKGILLAEVQIEKQTISNPAFCAFTDEIIKRTFDLDFATRKKGGISIIGQANNIQINEMKDGTIVVSTDLETSSTTTTSNMTTYFSGPLFHAFFKPDGKTSLAFVPKKQVSTIFTGYTTHVFEDKLICIFSDHSRNHQKEMEDKDINLIRTPEGIIPIAVGYDSNAKLLFKNPVIDSKTKMKGHVITPSALLYEKNKILFVVGEIKLSMIKYYSRVNHLLYLEIL
jgi:hypothetical protein